ncbi:MAG: metallophosphoesterase [Alphaproteobacteria bacterium]|nr:metallophosphoesterase [Alphaproteobacteria bacterium]
MKFLFTADLHGNELQYKKIFDHLNNENFDLIILGGDLSPKSKDKRNPTEQKNFFKQIFFEHTKSAKVPTFLILGNDDYRQNLFFLKEHEKQNNFQLIDEPQKIEKYTFVGYSYVPYTPFVWKDWERRDLATDKQQNLREDVLKIGKIDFDKPYNILEDFSKHSIEEDLNTLCQNINTQQLILITHTPPINTVCDLTKDKNGQLRHIGSQAVRSFIEAKQPLLTLHGHIHDSVINSKQYMCNIGRTITATVGNDHLTNEVFALEVTLSNTINIKRIKI